MKKLTEEQRIELINEIKSKIDSFHGRERATLSTRLYRLEHIDRVRELSEKNRRAKGIKKKVKKPNKAKKTILEVKKDDFSGLSKAMQLELAYINQSHKPFVMDKNAKVIKMYRVHYKKCSKCGKPCKHGEYTNLELMQDNIAYCEHCKDKVNLDLFKINGD